MPASALMPANKPVIRVHNTWPVVDALRPENHPDPPLHTMLEAKENHGVKPIAFEATLGAPEIDMDKQNGAYQLKLKKSAKGDYPAFQLAKNFGSQQCEFPGYYHPLEVTVPEYVFSRAFKIPTVYNMAGEKITPRIIHYGVRAEQHRFGVALDTDNDHTPDIWFLTEPKNK